MRPKRLILLCLVLFVTASVIAGDLILTDKLVPQTQKVGDMVGERQPEQLFLWSKGEIYYKNREDIQKIHELVKEKQAKKATGDEIKKIRGERMLTFSCRNKILIFGGKTWTNPNRQNRRQGDEVLGFG